MKVMPHDRMIIIKSTMNKNSILKFIIFYIACVFISCTSNKLEKLIEENNSLYVVLYANSYPLKNKTIEICYPYQDIWYQLNSDNRTKCYANSLKQIVIRGDTINLPSDHVLLRDSIKMLYDVINMYDGNYVNLLNRYFFCYCEFSKQQHCCLEQIRNECGSSIYFGHKYTPYYVVDGDIELDNNIINLVIALLYKNEVYCFLDINGNICLEESTVSYKDVQYVPFPNIEIR